MHIFALIVKRFCEVVAIALDVVRNWIGNKFGECKMHVQMEE